MPRYRAMFHDRVLRATAALNAVDGVSITAPDAGFFLFPKVDGDEVAIARGWLEHLNIAVLPGTALRQGRRGAPAHLPQLSRSGSRGRAAAHCGRGHLTMTGIARTAETAIRCTLMRGGTSKGPFFLAGDLPSDVATRDRVLLAVMGSPDVRQIDGIGGADPLTSKVGIVSRSTREGVDLDFLFAQVSVDRALVDTTPNCGNMLAAVVPFALEQGLLVPTGDTTTARVLTLNTDMLADITVQTPGGHLAVEGDCRIDGVPGSTHPSRSTFSTSPGRCANPCCRPDASSTSCSASP